jgi:hypothetical protein
MLSDSPMGLDGKPFEDRGERGRFPTGLAGAKTKGAFCGAKTIACAGKARIAGNTPISN